MSLTAETAALPQIHDWWNARCQEDWNPEILAMLDTVSLDAIACRHGLSRASLVDIAESDPSACREMIRMMRALNIDPAEAAGEPDFVEMAENCAGCPHKGRCREHLDEGHALVALDTLCANAGALNAMRAMPHLLDHA